MTSKLANSPLSYHLIASVSLRVFTYINWLIDECLYLFDASFTTLLSSLVFL